MARFNIHKAVYDGLIQRGVKPEVAKGAVASLMGEGGHGLDPSSTNKGDGRDGSDSIGFGQWNSSRARALKATAQKMGTDWKDPRAQVQHLFNEIDGSEKGTLQQLQTAKSANDGVRIWTTSYERPADKPGESINRRQNLAAAERIIGTGGDTTMANTQTASASATRPAAPVEPKREVSLNQYSFGAGNPGFRSEGILAQDAPAPANPADAKPVVASNDPSMLSRAAGAVSDAFISPAAASDNPPIPPSARVNTAADSAKVGNPLNPAYAPEGLAKYHQSRVDGRGRAANDVTADFIVGSEGQDKIGSTTRSGIYPAFQNDFSGWVNAQKQLEARNGAPSRPVAPLIQRDAAPAIPSIVSPANAAPAPAIKPTAPQPVAPGLLAAETPAAAAVVAPAQPRVVPTALGPAAQSAGARSVEDLKVWASRPGNQNTPAQQAAVAEFNRQEGAAIRDNLVANGTIKPNQTPATPATPPAQPPVAQPQPQPRPQQPAPQAAGILSDKYNNGVVQADGTVTPADVAALSPSQNNGRVVSPQEALGNNVRVPMNDLRYPQQPMQPVTPEQQTADADAADRAAAMNNLGRRFSGGRALVASGPTTNPATLAPVGQFDFARNGLLAGGPQMPAPVQGDYVDPKVTVTTTAPAPTPTPAEQPTPADPATVTGDSQNMPTPPSAYTDTTKLEGEDQARADQADKEKWLKALAGATDGLGMIANGFKKPIIPGAATNASYNLPKVSELSKLRPYGYQGGTRFRGLLG